MAFFDCIVGGSGKGNTLVVTCADELAGATITCTNGTKTYTKTCPSTSPYEVTFYGLMAGTWTVSATVSGNTYTTTVVVVDCAALLGGFNWRTWVDTAQFLDSTDYNSLSEVLADEEAVRELCLEHACVDYMAEITADSADVETIINTDLFAKWVNNSDYSLDILGANVAIKALMDTADKYGYGEWVITDDTTTPPTWGPKGNVPIMTANNAPYGEASATNASSGYEAYRAFSDVVDSRWVSTSTANAYIQYKSVNPINVKKIGIEPSFDNLMHRRVKNWKYQASNDGVTFIDVYSGQCEAVKKFQIFDIENNNYYLYHRILVIDTDDNCTICIYTLQFYGRELKVSVPKMTSNTAPYGEVLSSGNPSGYEAYKAFDNTTSTYGSVSLGANGYIGYRFTSDVVIKRIDFDETANKRLLTFKIQGSNTGNVNDWFDISDTITVPSSHIVSQSIDNNSSYQYIRILQMTATDGNVAYDRIQFYGFDYSEKEFEEGTTKKWLYDHGLELEPITIGSQCTKESTQIVCNGLSDDYTSKTIANTTNGVNLSPYNLMRGIFGNKCKSSSDGFGAVLVFTSTTIDWGTSWLANEQCQSIPNPNTTIHLGISSINESKIVGFGCGGDSGRQLSISELWLE